MTVTNKSKIKEKGIWSNKEIKEKIKSLERDNQQRIQDEARINKRYSALELKIFNLEIRLEDAIAYVMNQANAFDDRLDNIGEK